MQQDQNEIKELRNGITVKEVNGIADNIAKKFLLPSMGEPAPKEIILDGYQVAEVAKLLENADEKLLDEVATLPYADYVRVAKEVTPALKELFTDDSLSKFTNEELAAEVDALKDSGVEMQRKLSEAQDKEAKAYNRLSESESNLEIALDANKELHRVLMRNSERSDKLLDLSVNLSTLLNK